jgi:hypothetical protein
MGSGIDEMRISTGAAEAGRRSGSQAHCRFVASSVVARYVPVSR